MKLSEVYGQSRDRLIALSRELSEAELAAVVVPTPLWTVADVYRHLLGVATDIAQQNLEGRGTPAWTAAQVARSAHLSVPEVCERWAAQASEFEAAIDAGGPKMTAPCFDVWTHEQDVLGVLARPIDRTDAAVNTLTESAIALFSHASMAPEPPVRFVLDARQFVLGDGAPELTLRTTEFEFLRLSLGRRSAAQLAKAHWTGTDPERVFAQLSRFDLPAVDIAD